MEQIWQDIKARKIRIKHGPDILRWGHLPKGSFTIKEAYSILATKEEDHQFPLWKKYRILMFGPQNFHLSLVALSQVHPHLGQP